MKSDEGHAMAASNLKMKIEKEEQKAPKGQPDLDRMNQQV